MISEKERQIIHNYMQAVCDKQSNTGHSDDAIITPLDENPMTGLEANHYYGQLLNAADDAMREMLQ